MTPAVALAYLARLEAQVQNKIAFLRDNTRNFHQDSGITEEEAENQFRYWTERATFEKGRLELSLDELARLTEDLRSKLDSEQNLGVTELLALKFALWVCECDSPVYQHGYVTAEFGPVRLTFEGPLERFKRGLVVSIIEADCAVTNVFTDQLELSNVQGEQGGLQTVDVRGKLSWRVSGNVEQNLMAAVESMRVVLDHQVEPLGRVKNSIRHVVLSRLRID